MTPKRESVYIGRGYEFSRVAPGLILVRHPRYGQQIWSLARLTKRRLGDACAACNRPVGPKAYRPLTNLGNRMMRICLECAQEPVG